MHNPLDDQDEGYQRRVRERAYHLWQADGQPHGRDQEYWHRAIRLVGIEESGNSGQLPNPGTEATMPFSGPVEEASIQENLGEFPDRLSDQGEHAQTPSAKGRRAASKVTPIGSTSAALTPDIPEPEMPTPETPAAEQGTASVKPKRRVAAKKA